MPRMEWAGATHVGRVRRNNEDTYAVHPEICLAIVADGMGGAACGEVASALTVDEVTRVLRDPPAGSARGELLLSAVRAANAKVWEAAQTQDGCNGMGSTLVLAHWEGNHLWIVNVGDSRAYRMRGGLLQQLSFDQNVANELRATLGLTDAQINQYPYRNALTMAIGTAERVTARMVEEDLEDGDAVLLCSDGLSGPVDDPHIASMVAGDGDLQATVEGLINAANTAGGPDNVTAVLLRYRD